MLAPILGGLLLGGSLIVAIGAQNAFVIRQGIIGRHVFWICAFCAACDAILIVVGVAGLGAVIKAMPGFLGLMTYGGAAYLSWHGFNALRRVFRPAAMSAANEFALPLRQALLTCAGFTLLNPHVYLDTVLLIGSIANARPAGEQWSFAFGACLASVLWFYGIGFGALAMRRWLARPAVWRAIDATIAIIMFVLAGRLVLG